MKIYSSLIVISIAFLIFSCSNGKTKQPAQIVETPIETNVYQTKDSSKDYLKLGFELMQNENLNNLKIGLKAKDLRSILGNPSEESKPELWGADGMLHQTVKYLTVGVKLDLIQKIDSSYSINMITINPPCKFKTQKGIGIDSDYKNVETAYQKYIDIKSSNENEIVAGSIYGGIIFRFENQKVKSIFIGAAAE